ncbi:hypothetical protein [Bradyrhizobium sp.]|uniref:hypothetical protein n=1 Tax=Bradyrhizobium sp. TaxID=376 RepID=UPI001DDE22C0|nr:hypothetical protein [Bradyrhizobium sp.]MBI5318007.1 hypothetical protein [Bradyrhizobium sp.]
MKLAKIIVGVLFLAVLASNIFAISRWNESRGVYDDVCYLRQAHLFQRFGLAGFDTNVTRDDDRYLAGKLREIGFDQWNVPTMAPCHPFIERTQRNVLQYPPGTGAVLALFPAGFQVIPLYVTASLAVFAMALVALFRASSPATLALSAIFGLAALYLMINPTKASYSMAPTMIVCALAGFFTARLFASAAWRERLWLAAVVGFLIGLSATFRLPNLFLSAGYCIFFLAAFLLARSRQTFFEGLAFGVALLVGIAPTLASNWVNAGSPFATTYGGVDAVPPGIDMTVLRSYLVDVQFFLLVAAVAWTVAIWRRRGARPAVLVVAANLAVNIIFFMTHPVFTPYYTVPIAMLSLWSLLFATLAPRETAADNPAPAQPAKA